MNFLITIEKKSIIYDNKHRIFVVVADGEKK